MDYYCLKDFNITKVFSHCTQFLKPKQCIAPMFPEESQLGNLHRQRREIFEWLAIATLAVTAAVQETQIAEIT